MSNNPCAGKKNELIYAKAWYPLNTIRSVLEDYNQPWFQNGCRWTTTRLSDQTTYFT